MTKKCPNCDTLFEPKKYNLARGGGKYCSQDCYRKGPKVATQMGIKSPFWRGADAHVGSIHDAMKKVNGVAYKCVSSTCLRKSKTFDWALKKGCRYEDRNPNDYIQLCRRCHKAYDFKEGEHKRNSKGIFI